MNMIAILLASGLRPLMSWMEALRAAPWPERYFQWISERVLTPVQPDWLKLLILIVPVSLVLLLVQWLISGVLFGLLWLALSVLSLLYAQGILTNTHYLDRFFAATEQNDPTAQAEALAAFPETRPGLASETENWSLSGQLTYRVLTQSNEKLFALFFWFLLSGPVGLLLYTVLIRLERWECDTHPTRTLGRLLCNLIELLEWLPARLGVLSFAVVGNFTGAIDAALGAQPGGWAENGNARLLLASGLGALDQTPETECLAQEDIALLRDSRDLVARTFILWLSVIAVATLVGLLS